VKNLLEIHFRRQFYNLISREEKMRRLKNFMMLIFILILYITSYSQNFRVLLDDYKKECQKLDKLYANNEILSVSQIKEIDRIKRNISQIKKKLKTQNLIKPSKSRVDII